MIWASGGALKHDWAWVPDLGGCACVLARATASWGKCISLYALLRLSLDSWSSQNKDLVLERLRKSHLLTFEFMIDWRMLWPS